MWEKQLAAAIKAGELAKRTILQIYNSHFDVEIKDDKSPVTMADKKADKIIRDFLKKEFPDYSFLTEESVDDKSRLKNDYVWIVDPLDGTCNFVAKNDQFTINIALAFKHKVVLGVIIIPVTGEIYYATRHGGAFYSNKGTVREINVNRKSKDLLVLTSISHHGKEEELKFKKYGDLIKETRPVGAAIKHCLIAKGDAELSFRLNDKTKEWDTAAGQIIVKEANGIFIDAITGKPLEYNREDVVNRNGYIISNKKRNIIF